MQSILEQTVKTLHEVNSHPLTEPDQQYTILDGLRLLSDGSLRDRVLPRLRDSYLLEWWVRDFDGWRKEYQADALAPVRTRLNYYASSTRARAILGQPKSTIDLRRSPSWTAASCWSPPLRARSDATWPPWSGPPCSTWSTR